MPEGLGDNRNSAHIRDVTIVASDLVLQAVHYWDDDGQSKQLTRRERFAEWLAHEYSEPALPRTVETLVIDDDEIPSIETLLSDEKGLAPYSETAEWLDNALSALITAKHGEPNSGGQNETGQQGTGDSSERYELSTTIDGQDSRSGARYVYPHLKAVHVNTLGRSASIEEQHSRFWLAKSMQATLERGIESHAAKSFSYWRHKSSTES
ncbi:uncharacterized protein RHO25_007036 [Cercospora beticola]|uniref:Uncharacterized protein n=1 Tax=Cercospora beticola TaxID=122368 RepID=A0ABZ0NSF5_CERBT|nr:hypothetical protein RHO25_007036 [Cercospora beticola]CAK1362709.1 unnamed protein product [Cercospora beticola]